MIFIFWIGLGWIGLVDRRRFKRRGRGYYCWIHQNHLWNPYVQEGVMISLWNMMSRNLELTRNFLLFFFFYSLFSNPSHFSICMVVFGFVGAWLFGFIYLFIFIISLFSLVCTALYNDGDGERKYLPQFFKFIVANPLSVRTKVFSSLYGLELEFPNILLQFVFTN